MKTINFTFILLVLISFSIKAHPQKISLKHFTTANVLSVGSVIAIYQNSRAIMSFTTNKRLTSNAVLTISHYYPNEKDSSILKSGFTIGEDKEWWFSVLISILIVGLFVFFYYLKTKNIQKQNQRLKQAVAIKTNDLLESNTKLKEQKEALQNSLDKLKQTNKELQEKNKKLEEENLQIKTMAENEKKLHNLKTLFFTNISHELKTPLTIISTIAKQLKNNPKKIIPEKYQQIYTHSEDLKKLINELLDFRTIELDDLEINPQKQDIIPILNERLFSFQTLAQEQNINLMLVSSQKDLELWIDGEKIKKIITNLLSNALKFTPENGQITLSIKKHVETSSKFSEGYAKIKVSDTGIGITPQDIPKIFDRFYETASPQISLKQKGSGIGLSLVKQFVLAHRGQITVKSTKNKGTTFTIKLPLGNAHLAKKNIPINQPIAKTPEINLNELQKQNKTVLIVEDNKELLKLLHEELSQYFKTIKTFNGHKGYELAQQNKIDLILSDIMMPEMNGIEMCKKLKENTETSHIPVILLTAINEEEQEIQNIIKSGANDYITKPFNIEVLISKIYNILLLKEKIKKRLTQNLLLPEEINTNPIDKKFIVKLIKIIENQISNPDLNVENLSKELNLSHSTLFRKLKNIVAQSPSEFIRTVRLKKAAEMLQKNEKTITEIAYINGFNSTSYFSRTFKEYYGIGPKQYSLNPNEAKK